MKKNLNLAKYEKGQALVLVLLSLAVVLTLVLYILSRSVTDILVSSKTEETSRAFSAAEAGIEQALVIGTGGSASLANSSGYTSSVTSVSENSHDFNYPIELSSGDTFTTWFTAHDANSNSICDDTHPCFTGNTLKICWGKVGTSASAATTPAIEASVFYESTPGSLASIKIARYAVDPSAARLSSNSFALTDAGTCAIGGVQYQFQKTITLSDLGIPAAAYDVQNGLQFMRIRMFYNTDVTYPAGITTEFAGSSALPSQGQNISSSGTAGTSTRRINVFQGWPEVPNVLDFAVYSSTGLTK